MLFSQKYWAMQWESSLSLLLEVIWHIYWFKSGNWRDRSDLVKIWQKLTQNVWQIFTKGARFTQRSNFCKQTLNFNWSVTGRWLHLFLSIMANDGQSSTSIPEINFTSNRFCSTYRRKTIFRTFDVTALNELYLLERIFLFVKIKNQLCHKSARNRPILNTFVSKSLILFECFGDNTLKELPWTSKT